MARPSKNIAVAHALWLDAGQAAICEFCSDRSGYLILAVFSFLSKVNGLETRLFRGGRSRHPGVAGQESPLNRF
jgi:hypothetical protein